MSIPNDGGPAFPCQPLDGQGMPCNAAFTGMTLRDWFAGQALHNEYMGDYSPREQGRVAYEIADSMIAAREKRGAK